jgi:hypothetical protein
MSTFSHINRLNGIRFKAISDGLAAIAAEIDVVVKSGGLSHVEHLNAALRFALVAADHKAPLGGSMPRLLRTLEAHRLVVLTATFAFYVSGTESLLGVAALLSRLAVLESKNTSNRSKQSDAKATELRVRIAEAIAEAGAVVSWEAAHVGNGYATSDAKGETFSALSRYLND